MKQPRGRGTLVTWHAERAGVGVLTDTLKLLTGRGVHIHEVLYLVQSERGPRPSARDLDGIGLEVLHVPLADPTAHRLIHEAIRTRVAPRLTAIEGTLHINISPGTPAMHAVWLILHAAGALPPNVKLWSSQKVDGGATRIDPVDFPINTYLAEIRRIARKDPQIARYDPECASPARKRALEILQRFARVPCAPLLIVGERGTGKTRLVEAWVGTLKGRSKVVSVACGTLDPALAMSMLFGHKKGAFTGAQHDQPGFVEEAKGGVLFLDEVQDLPSDVQRQLVRFLQDGRRRYRRVGETDERTADVEVVTASHRGLDQLAELLDDDLFDRLSLLVVEIPPLRECREDLRDDWARVWCEIRGGEDEAPWTPVIEEALRSSRLPGNLRDLQRLALHLISSEGRTELDIAREVKEWKHFLLKIRVSGEDRKQVVDGTWQALVRAFKRDLALRARAEHGTFAAAAAVLKTDERTLRENAHETGLRRPRNGS